MQFARAILIVGGLLATQSGAEAPLSSLRPPAKAVGERLAFSTDVQHVSVRGSEAGFARWKNSFRHRALAEGIHADVYDRTMRRATYNRKIIDRDRNQSEFSKTIWDYLSTAVSDARISNGRAALQRYGADLARIERRYEVDREIVVAIWGLESAYGSFRGSDDTIGALSTLAYDARRPEFFQTQLIAALAIVQAGDVRAEDMRGSWAGAMGHTQFMPTSFLSHAVDYTGDGRRDIWSDDPRDALASTAAYLEHFGWKKGQPWGVEVRLPKGFDFTQADRKIRKQPSQWAKLGVTGMDGRPVRDYGEASVLLPAGAQGATFLVFDNFAVIERYNPADAYVIGVGHLADRIAGGPAIRGGWPHGDRALSFDERKELQARLTAAGFDTQKVDGLIGSLTIDAIRGWQKANGLLPDGYASVRLLDALR